MCFNVTSKDPRCNMTMNNNATIFSNISLNTTIDIDKRIPAAEEFFNLLLLGKSEKIEDFGVPQKYYALVLLGAWIVVCLCIIRGVKSSGKVAYFTAIFPYIVLTILIIQSGTLKGAIDGVKFYVIPQWDRVGQQMCIVVSCDCLTGVFAGFAVFSTIGFLAKELNVTVDSYSARSGPGLAFITYPEAITHSQYGDVPASPFFSIIFFLMLLTLGLGSQFAYTDVPITTLVELCPRLKNKRSSAVIITCATAYLVSLPFTCPGGYYWFELLQEYAANLSMIVVGFIEVITVAYIYGFNRFMNDVKMMIEKRAAEYFLFFTWRISAPLLMLIIIISKLIQSKPLESGTYKFPNWSLALGWIIFIICCIPIPIVYIIHYIREYRQISRQDSLQALNYKTQYQLKFDREHEEQPRYLEAFTRINLPADDWGPKKNVNRIGIYAHLNKNIVPMNGYSVVEKETGSINDSESLSIPRFNGVKSQHYIDDDGFIRERLIYGNGNAKQINLVAQQARANQISSVNNSGQIFVISDQNVELAYVVETVVTELTQVEDEMKSGTLNGQARSLITRILYNMQCLHSNILVKLVTDIENNEHNVDFLTSEQKLVLYRQLFSKNPSITSLNMSMASLLKHLIYEQNIDFVKQNVSNKKDETEPAIIVQLRISTTFTLPTNIDNNAFHLFEVHCLPFFVQNVGYETTEVPIFIGMNVKTNKFIELYRRGYGDVSMFVD
ncbi:unnamed protein product [Didymodactylos carnosus]|uniref:Uncharacterized protein n=1 Tax=Didymodactylos carnosus TaxID=1234261 RepID=A0A814EZL4_9BILA|nr:unnamed protein product [Didymodactylos carnosus]CAF3748962.1 unnamed protein product [Didymodactylos carnosus]